MTTTRTTRGLLTALAIGSGMVCGMHAAGTPQGGEEERSYAVALIPSGLTGSSPALIRDHLVRIEVTDRKRVSISVTLAVTVFHRDGREEPRVVLPYDRFTSIKELEGTLYDGSGKEIRELADEEIVDESDIDAASLYEDARVRTAEMLHDRYPYTVAIKHRVVRNGYLGLPRWVAQSGKLPVERSRLEILVPEGVRLRYWPLCDSLAPRITKEASGGTRYAWEAGNLPEKSEDDLAEDLEQRTSVVQMAPADFELDGHRGDMSTWQGFAAWEGELYRGKNDLSPEGRREALEVVREAKTTREKVGRLYRYMQSRTRYVSVQLGIGGWEPYPAMYVHQRGYGDCKALANYMIALLDAVGIPSLPAVIDAGGRRSDTIEEFPANSFNHVIVCVPEKKDSIWLECTSQTNAPGYLGSFTEGRPALLLTPGGGLLVRTPASSAGQNTLHRRGRIALNVGGRGTGEIAVDWSGNQAGVFRSLLAYAPEVEREQWLRKQFQVSGTTLAGYTVQRPGARDSLLGVRMQIDFPRLATTSGERIFLQPNLTDRNDAPPKERPHRKSPYRFAYPYLDADSLRYVLPPRYGIEALPPPVTLHSSFGSFRSSCTALGDTALLYTRRLEIRQKEVPAVHYGEFVKFFRDVVRADRGQIVLVSKP